MSTNRVVVHCNKCSGERQHEVLHFERVPWQEEIPGHYTVEGCNSYELVKCCGCHNVSLWHQSWFSEIEDENGRPIITTKIYPPAIYGREPKWLQTLFRYFPDDGDFITDLMKDIYVALTNQSPRLALMGVRALLEQVMIDKVDDQGSFKRNITQFEARGFVTAKQREILEVVIEAGHAVTHRAFKPTMRDVDNVIAITENIIESTYVNSERISEIRKNIPGRK